MDVDARFRIGDRLSVFAAFEVIEPCLCAMCLKTDSKATPTVDCNKVMRSRDDEGSAPRSQEMQQPENPEESLTGMCVSTLTVKRDPSVLP